jgi:hypothetical protein
MLGDWRDWQVYGKSNQQVQPAFRRLGDRGPLCFPAKIAKIWTCAKGSGMIFTPKAYRQMCHCL